MEDYISCQAGTWHHLVLLPYHKWQDSVSWSWGHQNEGLNLFVHLSVEGNVVTNNWPAPGPHPAEDIALT